MSCNKPADLYSIDIGTPSSTPRYNPSTLTEWYHSDVPGRVSRLFQYHRDRTSMVLEMIEVAEVVTKTS